MSNPYENRYHSTFIAALWIIPIMSVVCYFTGCASDLTPAQQASLNKIEEDVVPIVANYASTGQVNYAQVIPLAIDSVTAFDPSLPVTSAQVQTTVANAITAFTSGNGKTTAQKIAAVVAANLPANPTGADANAALVKASLGASTGANPTP